MRRSILLILACLCAAISIGALVIYLPHYPASYEATLWYGLAFAAPGAAAILLVQQVRQAR